MRKLIALALLCLSLSASAALTSVTESTVITLYRGTSKVADHPTLGSCQLAARTAANASLATSGIATYSCKNEAWKLVATYAPNPPLTCPAVPPPQVRQANCPSGTTGTWMQTGTTSLSAPPACSPTVTWAPSSPRPTDCPPIPTCPAAPAPRQNACPAGFIGTWTQTATVGPPPTCALNWQPVAPGAGACTPTSQPPVTPIFTDRFEYDVTRASGPPSAFTSRGWLGAKANNLSGSGAGFIYTQPNASISSRVLVLESLPSTSGSLGPGFEGGQTDYYLQIGREDLPTTTIPANVWFQFKTFATPASSFARRDKTLYPCRTHYACSTLGGSLAWMLMWGKGGFEDADGPAANRYLAVIAEHADFRAAGEYPTNKGKLFQNVSKAQLVAGRWYVVKLHFDTSGAQGVYQAWIADLGSTTWTQLADWRGGVTPNFSWPIPVEQRVGHRVLRLPTTVNGPGDSMTYLDDFTMAGSEAGLPQ